MEYNQEDIKNAVKNTVNGLRDFYMETASTPTPVMTIQNGDDYKVGITINSDFGVEINMSGLNIKFDVDFSATRIEANAQ